MFVSARTTRGVVLTPNSLSKVCLRCEAAVLLINDKFFCCDVAMSNVLRSLKIIIFFVYAKSTSGMSFSRCPRTRFCDIVIL